MAYGVCKICGKEICTLCTSLFDGLHDDCEKPGSKEQLINSLPCKVDAIVPPIPKPDVRIEGGKY